MTDLTLWVVLLATLSIVVFAAFAYFVFFKPALPGLPPPPGIPACEVPADRKGDVLKNVYHPARLRILNECAIAKGVVTLVKKEGDGDYHIDLQCDPDSPTQPQMQLIPAALTADNLTVDHYHTPNTLICEIIPWDQTDGSGSHMPSTGPSGLNLEPPAVGSHVVFYGVNCHDNIHGWDELHSVSKILIL